MKSGLIRSMLDLLIPEVQFFNLLQKTKCSIYGDFSFPRYKISESKYFPMFERLGHTPCCSNLT